MRVDVYNALPNKPPLQPRFLNLGAVNNSPIPNVGEIYASIRIDLINFNWPIVVIPHMRSEFILGNDFLRKYRTLLDQDRNRLVIHTDTSTQASINKEKQFLKVPPVTPFYQKLYLDEQLILDPRSRTTYQLPNTNGSFSGIVEPSSSFRRLFKASVARTLSAVRNGIMLVQFLNMEYHPIMIPAGTLIGHFVPYEDILEQRTSSQIASIDGTQVPPSAKEEFFKKIDHSFNKSKISSNQSLQLKEVLFHYHDLFDEKEGEMSMMSNVKCHITLNDSNAQPVQEKLRRTTPQQKAVIK